MEPTQQPNVSVTTENSQKGFSTVALERHYTVSELSKLCFLARTPFEGCSPRIRE
jgi:hypothetical protein